MRSVRRSALLMGRVKVIRILTLLRDSPRSFPELTRIRGPSTSRRPVDWVRFVRDRTCSVGSGASPPNAGIPARIPSNPSPHLPDVVPRVQRVSDWVAQLRIRLPSSCPAFPADKTEFLTRRVKLSLGNRSVTLYAESPSKRPPGPDVSLRVRSRFTTSCYALPELLVASD